MRSITRLIVIAFLLVVFAPSIARAEDFDHAGLARQTLERHIRPGYARFADATAALKQEAAGFCSVDPTDDRDKLEGAFRDVLEAWSRIEHIHFGPVAGDHRYSRILFWPDPKGIGTRQVVRTLRRRDPTVTSADTLQEKSVALQGLTAFEYLLYGPGKELLSRAGRARDFRCSYLRAVADNLSNIAEQLKTEWIDPDGFTRTLLNPGPDNPAHRTPKDVTQEIAKAFLGGLDWVKDLKIAGPLGFREKKSRPTKAPFARSGLSTVSVIANLEGLRDLFVAGGLAERIGAFSSGMDSAILNDFDQILKTLQSLGMPIDDAASDPESTDKLIAVGFPLKNIRQVSLGVLAEAAGIVRGFNAADGD